MAVTREAFVSGLREFLLIHGLELAMSDENASTLFRISDEFCRIKTVLAQMKVEKVREDWGRRTRLMKSIEQRLATIRGVLEGASLREKSPMTSLLARSTRDKLAAFERKIGPDFQAIKHDQRCSETTLRSLSKQKLRAEYFGVLDEYVLNAFRGLKGTERDVIVAGAMAAARFFTKKEITEDVISRLPMIRSRAREFTNREYRDVERVRLWKKS
jgi:hypothetical protein